MAATVTAGGSRIARIYAEALMANAVKANRVDAVGEELDELVTAVYGNPTVVSHISTPLISWRAKAPMLNTALGGRVSDLMRSFIGVLNKNGRMALLPDLRAAYKTLQDNAAGRMQVSVKTAVPLGSEQQASLASTLATYFKKQPVLNLKVDPDLLGGIVVQIGDRVYDTSVRTRIQALRAQLMERGTSYVLQN